MFLYFYIDGKIFMNRLVKKRLINYCEDVLYQIIRIYCLLFYIVYRYDIFDFNKEIILNNQLILYKYEMQFKC